MIQLIMITIVATYYDYDRSYDRSSVIVQATGSSFYEKVSSILNGPLITSIKLFRHAAIERTPLGSSSGLGWGLFRKVPFLDVGLDGDDVDLEEMGLMRP